MDVTNRYVLFVFIAVDLKLNMKLQLLLVTTFLGCTAVLVNVNQIAIWTLF